MTSAHGASYELDYTFGYQPVVNDEAAKAHNLFPEVQAVRANYNDFATLVTKAAMKMISTQEPTAKALSDLQAELERQVPLK